MKGVEWMLNYIVSRGAFDPWGISRVYLYFTKTKETCMRK
jgi:hypothetical protein